MDFDVALFKKVYDAHVNGMTFAEIGRKFDIASTRVRKIVLRYEEELEDLKDPMYETILEYVPFHEIGVKMYRALKNAGFHSFEDLSRLSKSEIREINNIGNLMTSIIVQICEDKRIALENDHPQDLKRQELKDLCYKHTKTVQVGSRLFNILEDCGIYTVEDLMSENLFQLIDQYGIGKRTIDILINMQTMG